MTDPTSDTPLVRRPAGGTRAQFRKRPLPAAQQSGGDELLGKPKPKEGRITERRREIASELPEWEPLPPGELTFRRK